MKTTQCALVGLFFLILTYCIMFSGVSINSETRSNRIDRFSPRKLLAHVSLKISYEALQKSLGTSLKKAPPSKPSPIHNKWLWCHLCEDLNCKEELDLTSFYIFAVCPVNCLLGRFVIKITFFTYLAVRNLLNFPFFLAHKKTSQLMQHEYTIGKIYVLYLCFNILDHLRVADFWQKEYILFEDHIKNHVH